MAFHYSNFGSFGRDLKRFADIDGYVPERGDGLERFHFPRGHFDDPEATEEEIEEEWDEFVERAVEATEEVQEELDEWCDDTPSMR